MPFAMTHLHIAYNILTSTPQIKNPYDFLLGSIAPDSVHFRDNYNSNMKFDSHLCIGNERWGRVTNNTEWLENVLSFLSKYSDTEAVDFIYGYCCHILADIQNNIKVWMPFFSKNKEKLKNGMGSLYHQESFAIDYELYLFPNREIMWSMLKESTAYDIPGFVNSHEVNEMKQSLLNDQFTDRETIDVTHNKYVTLLNIQEFISEESLYIKNILYSK
ncbi:zinc dependent phospholipase C family protein [Vallitalea okinawensis]|uniref:zinc dependent phospholipase C family protein n=1 Tax=Vallitalea okinawensis TaxID=2078660 RepID=UPI000CFBF9EE|nr:zinc dependent phospholipase C family protein [Vallitalea okinawensis]